MNKLLKRYAITYLCICFFLYIGGSFIALSFNPADWDSGARLLLWFLSIVWTWVAVPLVGEEYV